MDVRWMETFEELTSRAYHVHSLEKDDTWKVIFTRGPQGAIQFYLKDNNTEVRPIEWMEYHPAIELADWDDFDLEVKNCRELLDEARLASLPVDGKTKARKEFEELNKLSDKDLLLNTERVKNFNFRFAVLSS